MSALPTSYVDSSVLGPEVSLIADDNLFRQEFRSWLQANWTVEPEPLNQDEKFAFRRDWQRKLFDGGWAGPAWPAQYGGRGAGALDQIMYYEELALARAPHAVNEPGIILLGPTLMIHGEDALKDRFLSGILSGQEIWCQGFSEPDAGSDLASLRCRAHLEDGEWVVAGQKIWTTWAQYADWCFLLCRTVAGSERHRGLTMLIVPMDQANITSNPIVQISGDPEFGEVFFDEARTDAALTVGEPGAGWAAAMTMFGFERADVGFTDHARLLVKVNDLAGVLREASEDGTITVAVRDQARHRLADIWSRSQQLRRLNLRAAIRIDRGEQMGVVGSAVNLLWADVQKDVSKLEAELHGAAGLTLHGRVSHGLLGSRAASIYSGTSEIQRNLVAERLLGLPR